MHRPAALRIPDLSECLDSQPAHEKGPNRAGSGIPLLVSDPNGI